MPSSYIGRFAPSPSGPLHFGSLVCALASYLDAKFHQGQWLVRIDDIDPPREQTGASELILACLKAHGLNWHEEVFYQSLQSQRYLQRLNQLQQLGLIYPCSCNRKRLASLNYCYDQHCVAHPPNSDTPAALRINLPACLKRFPQLQSAVTIDDQIQPTLQQDILPNGDFILHRKDGLFAYQLAVAEDDLFQGITHIVRGVDLYETTPQQVFLMRLFSLLDQHDYDERAIKYSHIPVIVNGQGNKLSKQNHAPAIDMQTPLANLIAACRALQLPPPQTAITDISTLLNWAVNNWHSSKLRNIQQISQDAVLHM